MTQNCYSRNTFPSLHVFKIRKLILPVVYWEHYRLAHITALYPLLCMQRKQNFTRFLKRQNISSLRNTSTFILEETDESSTSCWNDVSEEIGWYIYGR
jgi:hypothetical protein